MNVRKISFLFGKMLNISYKKISVKYLRRFNEMRGYVE